MRNGDDDGAFEPYLARWRLLADGAPIVTPSSRLLPVRRNGEPFMLKVAVAAEETLGNGLMSWWGGVGAARVLAAAGDAILLERAIGEGSLARMARDGQDEEATRVICAVAAQVHAPRAAPWPQLVPLAEWFRALGPGASRHGGILVRCAAAAGELLAAGPKSKALLDFAGASFHRAAIFARTFRSRAADRFGHRPAGGQRPTARCALGRDRCLGQSISPADGRHPMATCS